MINVPCILGKLEKDRQLFHSEADFQHEFAWKIHELYEDIGVRLEYPVTIGGRRRSVDVWLKNKKKIGIELKYKTYTFEWTDGQGEEFQLRNQDACDQGRYDFLKDIQRLETLKKDSVIDIGYAILLTNDCKYWDSTNDADAASREFYLTEGRTLPSPMNWNNAGGGTIEGRESPIELDHQDNPLAWKKYSKINEEDRGEFRYLLVSVY